MKTKLFAVTIIAILLMSTVVILLPSVNGRTKLTIPTWAYISVQPNPSGVGQEAFVNFWLDKVPPTATQQWGDRWEGYTVTVTKPDGTTEKLGPFTSDAAGGAWTTYTPTTTGNYSFVFNFPGQTLAGKNPAPGGAPNAQQIGD